MQRPVLALFALFAIVAFVACGGDDTARPTPAPTASVGAPLRSLSLIGSTRTAEVKVEIASTFEERAVGLLTALVVRSKEQEAVVADRKAAKAEAAQAHVISDTATAAAAAQLPLALIGALLSSTSGPVSVASVARTVGRNLPLVVLLAGIGFLFWPQEDGTQATETGVDVDRCVNRATPRPNGAYSSGDHRDAA